jgi:Tat protein secretion system quality control protein TatD with DNase activity
VLSEIEQIVTKHAGAVVAVGETGLDFNRNLSPPEVQIK